MTPWAVASMLGFCLFLCAALPGEAQVGLGGTFSGLEPGVHVDFLEPLSYLPLAYPAHKPSAHNSEEDPPRPS